MRLNKQVTKIGGKTLLERIMGMMCVFLLIFSGLSPTTRQADNRIVGQIVVKMEEEALPPDNLTLPDPQGFDVAIQVGDMHSWSFADVLKVDTNETSTHLVIKENSWSFEVVRMNQSEIQHSSFKKRCWTGFSSLSVKWTFG